MAKNTVIIHGWSDCSDSFKEMKAFLTRNGVGKVETIYYADYESREDHVTFEDVVGGLDDELRARRLIDRRGRGDLNVVVHSTGGLVIRHWIWRYYRDRIDECPVKNLVMLAPANFGSPLAHRGKSFLGQLFKGRWKIGDLFEIGRQLLDGLELASPYQWALAHRDLLGPAPFYDPDHIRLTVLVGLKDYDGMRGWVNKPGTDGTVVIAGTPLNSVKLRLDFTNRETPFRWTIERRPGRFAFGALGSYDHGSIVGAFGRRRAATAEPVLRYTLQALKVSGPNEFVRHCEELEAETERAFAPDPKTGAAPRRYQQFIVHAVDDQGESIRDFTLEFFVRRRDRSRGRRAFNAERDSKEESILTREAHARITSEFHTNSTDSSYRRLLVDVDEVRRLVPAGHLLAMRMYVPRVDRGIFYDTAHTQDIVIYDPEGADETAPKFFFPNTTTLVEMAVDRVTQYVTVGLQPKKR